MTSANTRTRYGTVAMTMHWIIAALVLTNIYLGLSFEYYPKGDPTLFKVVQIHKSIGLTVLVLSVLRLLWRLVNPVPPLPASMNAPLKFLARATHYLFYFLIIAIPLSGWLMVSTSRLGLPTSYFGLFDWPNVGFIANMPLNQRRLWHEPLETTHMLLAWSAIVLVAIHVAGALYHQFVTRDDVLKRMLPGTQVKEQG
ncbi:MAG: cytochrome b [Proteobacteria bacterium]|nr:cytochrome b [Pseudomonadota bacterium]